MNTTEFESWIKRGCVLIMILLFAAMSAQAAGTCENAGGKMERVAARSPSAAVDSSLVTPSASVEDNKALGLSSGEVPISSFLALHCEAVSNLTLGQAIRAYHGPACGESGQGSAVP
jgi:hypothetical protein